MSLLGHLSGCYFSWKSEYIYSLNRLKFFLLFPMSQSDKVDFSFRYRPNVDTPDGVLMRYLKRFEPLERRDLILNALRAFYAVAAYAAEGEINSPEELGQLADYLQEIDHFCSTHQTEVNLSVQTSVFKAGGHMTLQLRSGDSALED